MKTFWKIWIYKTGDVGIEKEGDIYIDAWVEQEGVRLRVREQSLEFVYHNVV